MTSIENFIINDTIHQSTNIASGFLKNAGVTSLQLESGTTIAAAALTVTHTSGQTLTLKGIADGDLADDTDGKGEIDITAAGADAAALAAITALNLSVEDIGSSATGGDIEIDVTGSSITRLNLTATGSNFIELINAGAAITTLAVSGAGNATIGVEAAMPAALKTVDASASTGKVTVSLGTNVSTVTGGTGNDKIIFTGTNFVGAEDTVVANRDTVNGGDGTDTLSLTIADAVAASTTKQTTITNIETLAINNAAAGTFDATVFTGVNRVVFEAALDDTNSYTVASGTTVALSANSTTDAVSTLVVAGTGTSDSVTLEMAGFDFTNGGTARLITTGIETLNINSGVTAADTAVIDGVTTMTASAGGLATIVVTGAAKMTFTGNVTTASINASALTGTLTVSGTAQNAINIQGGTAADVINGSAANDLLSGNAGGDTLTGRAGNDTLTGGAGNDKFTFSATTTNGTDTITDFTKTTQADILVLDATVGTGTADTVTLGAAITTTSRADFVSIITTNGTAASVTTSGTKTLALADFTATTLTNVAAFIAEKYTGNSSTTDGDVGVYVINYTAEGSTTTYVYQFDNDTTANVTQAAELALIGVVTRDAILASTDMTFA
jgi:Ca2+-binding RTX toxin-like protein